MVVFAQLCPLDENVKVAPPSVVIIQERLKYMLSDVFHNLKLSTSFFTGN